MSSIFTPVNQVKLTNVAVVRLKRAGRRFELACYKNKIADYRNKLTKDLDEVLQIRSVFVNVSKGQLAKKEDLLEAFGTEKEEEIIMQILSKGEVQVSGKERDAQLDSMFREIATIVADKCVNPRTRLPYPVSLIEKSMSDLHFSVNTTKSAKQQALELIKQLEKQQGFPISRAQMRLSVESPVAGAEIGELLAPMLAGEPEIDASVTFPAIKMTVLIDPGNFRQVHETVARASRSKGAVLTLNLKDLSKSDQHGQSQV